MMRSGGALTTTGGHGPGERKNMLGYRTKLALLLALATLPAAAQDFRGSVVRRNTTPRSAKAIDFFRV